MVPILQCGLVRWNFSLPIWLSVPAPAELSVWMSGVFRLDLVRDPFGDFGVVIELHGEGGASLAHGAQVVDVREHVGERHHGTDDVGVAAHVLALNMAAPRVEVADDRPG